jgi:hypothetical protein
MIAGFRMRSPCFKEGRPSKTTAIAGVSQDQAAALLIAEHGLCEPIVETPDELILDGRNRYRACLIAKVEPRYETYRGDDPLAFLVSLNLKRRHLDESRRAMVAANIANLTHGGDRKSDQAANLPLEVVSPPISQAAAAEMLTVGERTVRSAAVVRDNGSPELIEAVERGKASVSAAEVAKLPKPEQEEIVARGEAEIVRAANAIKRKRKEAKEDERQAANQIAAATVPPVAICDGLDRITANAEFRSPSVSRQHFDIWQFQTSDKDSGQQSYFGAMPPQV